HRIPHVHHLKVLALQVRKKSAKRGFPYEVGRDCRRGIGKDTVKPDNHQRSAHAPRLFDSNDYVLACEAALDRKIPEILPVHAVKIVIVMRGPYVDKILCHYG